MSLVATYVRADDGNLYNSPILSGNGWFICFDDDDPVEIVIRGIGKKKLKDKALEILNDLGIKHTRLTYNQGGKRLFSDDEDDYNFEDARSWFFEIENRIPAQAITKHDGIVSINDIYQGVIYDPK
jgi:hypothetical protein